MPRKLQEQAKGNVNDRQRYFLEYVRTFKAEIKGSGRSLATRYQEKLINAERHMQDIILHNGASDAMLKVLNNYIEMVYFGVESGSINVQNIPHLKTLFSNANPKISAEDFRKNYLKALLSLKSLVKGYLTDYARKKINKFKKLYDNINFEILKEKELKQLRVL